MAQFKDLVVAGDMRVGGNIHGSEPMKFFYLDPYPTSSNPFIIEDHEPGLYFFKPSSGHTNAYFKLNSDCTGYYYASNCWFIITNNHPEADGDEIGYQEWFGTGRLARTILKRDDSVNSKVSNTGIYYATGTGYLSNLKTSTKTDTVVAINELYDDMFYSAGDIIEIGATSGHAIQVQNGYVTSSTTQLYTTITLPKRLDNITTITANNITVEARGTSGYINSTSGYNEYVGTSGYTVDVQKVTGNPYAITITIGKSSAYTNVNNNTPIVMNGYFKFTLS